jgi:hypothetical protein
MKYIILLLLSLLCLTSCNEDRNSNDKPSSNPASVEVTIDSNKTIQELKDERQKLLVQLDGMNNLIKQKELERVTFYSKLVGYSSLGVATLCLVLSFIIISYPLLPTILRYVSYTLFIVGPLALTTPYLYPYLLPIGFLAMAVTFGFGALLWWRDRKSLVQVVTAVNETKNHIPDYKSKFRKVIDTKADKWINKVREKIPTRQ